MTHRTTGTVIKSPSASERLVHRLDEYLGHKRIQKAVTPVRPKAASRNVALNSRVDSRLPPVQANDERFVWVVGQLLDNDVKNELTHVMIAFFKGLAASRRSASAPHAES